MLLIKATTWDEAAADRGVGRDVRGRAVPVPRVGGRVLGTRDRAPVTAASPTAPGAAPASGDAAPAATPHPIRELLLQRSLLGLLTLLLVSVIVFAATQVLPGNAAYAVLGQTATPESLAALEHRLGLDQPAFVQYWHWLSGVLRGDLGTSLVGQQQPVGDLTFGRMRVREMKETSIAQISTSSCT